MSRLLKVLGVALILASIGVLFYAKVDDLKLTKDVNASNDKAIECYFEDKDCGTYGSESDSIKRKFGGNEVINSGLDTDNNVNNTNGEEDNKSLEDVNYTEGMLGVFYADDIGLVEPLYQGATFNNLARGLGVVGEGTLEDQNVNIAGHRVEGFDIRFNRINELSKGSIIKIKKKVDGKIEEDVYQITDKYLVDESEVSVLEQDNTKTTQELTLITCDSYNELTGEWEDRLILKADKVE